MRPFALITIAALFFIGCGQRAGTDDEVRQAEERWAAAVMAGDQAALDRLLADELIYGHSSGVVETKGEYLGKMQAGDLKYEAIHHESIDVKVLGDSALAHSRVHMKGASGGEPFDNRLVMLHVWVRQGGEWRLAGHQTARLP